ncbi:MAG: hypothetical protein J5523_09940 [Muribaculaceae bacterium]|nr:hypothetical protein [Muribaculaceae bacterium]
MKKLLIIALLGLVMASCADKKSQEAGQKAAADFVAAWSAGIAQADSAYKASLDSLNLIKGSAEDFNEAFLAAIEENGNDTIACAAMLLSLGGEDLAKRTAQPVVDGLLDGSLDREAANGKVQLVHFLAQELNLPDVAADWDARIEGLVKDLSVKNQMKVYAASSTPEDLAAALLEDANQPGADQKLIEEQVAALGEIYTPEEMQRFEAIYKKGVKN